MRLEDYTPDAICRAMGVPGFREDPALRASDPSLRLLLRPSFDPEVCVTLLTDATEDHVEVRTFPELFWHQPSPAYRPAVFTERVAVGRGVVADLALRWLETAGPLGAPGGDRWMVIDGMPVSAWGRSGGVERELDLNVGAANEFRHFVAGVIRQLHPVLPAGRCRNGLARAGRYVDLRLPLDRLPDLETGTRLLVLGHEEGRNQVADILQHERRQPRRGEPGNEDGR